MLYLYTDGMPIYLRKLRGWWHYIGHRMCMDYSAYRGSERPEGGLAYRASWQERERKQRYCPGSMRSAVRGFIVLLTETATLSRCASRRLLPDNAENSLDVQRYWRTECRGRRWADGWQVAAREFPVQSHTDQQTHVDEAYRTGMGHEHSHLLPPRHIVDVEHLHRILLVAHERSRREELHPHRRRRARRWLFLLSSGGGHSGRALRKRGTHEDAVSKMVTERAHNDLPQPRP